LFGLQENINHITILIHRPPVVLFNIVLYEDFIDVKGVAVSTMLPLQSSRLERSEFDTPQPDRFAADGDTTFSQQTLYISMAEIKSIVEPDSVADDVCGPRSRGKLWRLSLFIARFYQFTELTWRCPQQRWTSPNLRSRLQSN
jgi:hypothetical protein